MDLPQVNCTLFTANQASALALVRGIAGIITFVANFLALLLIIFYRAVDTTLQRLFLYLTISSLGVSLGFSLELEHVRYYHSKNSQEAELCSAVAFIVQYTEWVELLLTLGMTSYLLGGICHMTRRGSYRELVEGHRHSNRAQKCLEGGFVTFCVIFPAMFNWVPFIHHKYGEAGPWCWIRSLRPSCTESNWGFWEQVGLWYIPFMLIGGLSFAMIISMTMTFCYWACKFGERQIIKKLATRGVLLIVAFLIFLVMSSVEVGVRFDDHVHKTSEIYPWWLCYAVLTPLSMFLIPFAFLAYLYSVDRLKWEKIKEAKRKWKQDMARCCTKCPCSDQNDESQGQHAGVQSVNRMEYASAKPSDRESGISSSFFTPEHESVVYVEHPGTVQCDKHRCTIC